MTGYCPGHRERYDGTRCPTCDRGRTPGRRPRNPAAEHWPQWDTLAPCAGAITAVMDADLWTPVDNTLPPRATSTIGPTNDVSPAPLRTARALARPA